MSGKLHAIWSPQPIGWIDRLHLVRFTYSKCDEIAARQPKRWEPVTSYSISDTSILAEHHCERHL